MYKKRGRDRNILILFLFIFFEEQKLDELLRDSESTAKRNGYLHESSETPPWHYALLPCTVIWLPIPLKAGSPYILDMKILRLKIYLKRIKP